MANSSPVYDWFQERLEIQDIADDISTKYVPPHVNIFYCLGGITLVCFLIQFATGFAMTFYYKPTVAEAYSSVQYLMTDVSFGWLIRSVHRWSASNCQEYICYSSPVARICHRWEVSWVTSTPFHSNFVLISWYNV